MKTPDKILLLDRDGVINHESDAYIKSPDEFQPIAGSLQAIARLSAAGYSIFIVTNQSGLARGLFTRETLKAIHDKLVRLVENAGGKIAGIYYCPHGPNDGCNCRKPLPGLLHKIEADCGLKLTGRTFVGDSLRDLAAARAAGVFPVLVRTGHGAIAAEDPEAEGVPTYSDLGAFVRAFIPS